MLKPKNTRSGSTTDTSFPSNDFINRRTEFRFAGCTISLELSLGLFSSAGVDVGSTLLLKSIAKELNLDEINSVLDVGCGVGTLGLALASRCPDASVTMVDRDTLAVEFARHNAKINNLTNTHAETRLMTEGPHAGDYNLVLSNFPAKAGDSVLQDYLGQSMALLEPEGRAGIVIVHTLAERCRELIEDLGGEILLEDASRQHTVFHYRLPGTVSEPEDLSLAPYIRYHGEFKVKRTRYELDTVWNIGDFDTSSWRIRLLGEMLDTEAVKGNMLFWAPGQGHLPVQVCRRKGARPEKVIIADRDTLALKITEKNLCSQIPGIDVQQLNIADPSLLPDMDDAGTGTIDFLLTDLSPVPRSSWSEALREAASKLVVPGGRWAIVARSNDIATLTKYTKGWTTVADRRNKGWRALILKRNLPSS